MTSKAPSKCRVLDRADVIHMLGVDVAFFGPLLEALGGADTRNGLRERRVGSELDRRDRGSLKLDGERGPEVVFTTGAHSYGGFPIR